MELFISDLDGTLLNGNAEVTEFTRYTLPPLQGRLPPQEKYFRGLT